MEMEPFEPLSDEARYAVAVIAAMAQSLADLPPPSPQAPDDVGFAAGNDGPMREYLGMLAHRGVDGLPVEAHFAAASYLRVHKNTQLDAAQWQAAYDTLRRESVAKRQRASGGGGGGGRGRAPDKDYEEQIEEDSRALLKAGSRANTQAAGEVRGDGSWRMVERGGEPWVELDTTMRRGGPRLNGEAWVKGGLTKHRDFTFRTDPFRWIIRLGAIWAAADVLESLAWPKLAVALRAYFPVELTDDVGSGGPEGESPAPVGPQAPVVLDPRSGTTRSGFSWHWAGPESAERDVVSWLVQSRDRRHSIRVPTTLVVDKATEDWKFWIKVAVNDLPEFAYQLGDQQVSDVVAALLPQWQEGSKVQLTDSQQLTAKNLMARFRVMISPEIRKDSERIEKVLADVAPILLKVQPGDLSCDLGPYGVFKVVSGRHDGKIDEKAKVMVSVPFSMKDWAKSGSFASKKSPDANRRWWDEFSIKQVPAAARAMDHWSPPLAMAMRLAILTEKLRDCPEAEMLSGALREADIPNGEVRLKVAAYADAAQSRLKAGFTYRDYQRVGIGYLALLGFQGLVGDAMGVGKTLTAIGAILTNPSAMTPALVVAPASVVYNWQNEIRNKTEGLRPVVVDSNTHWGMFGVNDVAIVSWGALALHAEAIVQSGRFKTLVLDESHYAKNATAGRTKAAILVATKIPHRILLSGTAMENRPQELWAQLHIVSPDAFPDQKEFTTRYASKGKRVVNGITFTDRGTTDLKVEPATEQDQFVVLVDDKAVGLIRRYPEEQSNLKKRKKKGKNEDGLVWQYKTNASFDWNEKEFREQDKCIDKLVVASGVPYGSPMLMRLLELREELRCFMIRRTKDEVLSELPPKTRTYLWVDLPPKVQRHYDMLVENIEGFVLAIWKYKILRETVPVLAEQLGTDDPNVIAAEINIPEKTEGMRKSIALVAIGYLRRLVGEAKAPMVAEWIKDWIEQNPGEQILAWFDHGKPWRAVAAALDEDDDIEYAVIDGSTPPKKRAELVAKAQDGVYDVVIGTRAMAEGNTLTYGSTSIFGERWWVPSKEEQAEDRQHRIGQKNNVNVYYMMANNTYDVDIYEIVDAKRTIINAVMSGEDTEVLENGQRRGRGQTSDGALSGVGGKHLFARILRTPVDLVIEPSEIRDALRGILPPDPLAAYAEEFESSLSPEAEVEAEIQSVPPVDPDEAFAYIEARIPTHLRAYFDHNRDAIYARISAAARGE